MVRCPHRGSYEVGITRLRARDAFGLFSISRKSGMKLLRVDVYPKSHDAPFLELKAGDTRAGTALARHGGRLLALGRAQVAGGRRAEKKSTGN